MDIKSFCLLKPIKIRNNFGGLFLLYYHLVKIINLCYIVRGEYIMTDRIQNIIKNIPKKFYFEKCFESPSHIPKLLVEVQLSYKGIEHNNLFKCSPILTRTQEQLLFQKYNYLKYRLVKDTMGFEKSKDGPKPKKPTKLNRLKENSIKKLENIIEKINQTRNIIVKSNIRLSHYYVRKHVPVESFDGDEYISVCYENIMRAIDYFDYKKGNKFSTYCSYCIKSNVFKHKKKLSKSLVLLENNVLLPRIKDNEVDFRESNIEYNKKITKKILRAIKIKNGSEVLKHYYGIGTEPKHLRDVGKVLNISGERVRQIRDVAIKEAQILITYDPLC